MGKQQRTIFKTKTLWGNSTFLLEVTFASAYSPFKDSFNLPVDKVNVLGYQTIIFLRLNTISYEGNTQLSSPDCCVT